MSAEPKWDVFICHASEDKEDFVRPLAQELEAYDLRVWFDEFALKLGDSLRKKIEEGLAGSRYGVVVLSPASHDKGWPEQELSALFAREVDGHSVILPIWHRLGKAEVLNYWPLLADKLAANSADGIKTVARKIVEVVKPEALQMQARLASASRLAARIDEQIRQADGRFHASLTLNPDVEPDFEKLAASPHPPGAVASLIESGVKVDLIANEPSSYNAEPLEGHMLIKGEALAKIEEAFKTGERVTLGPELVSEVVFDIFSKVFPGLKPTTVILGPSPELKRIRLALRVTFTTASGKHLEYPFLEFGVDRAGSHEAVFSSRSNMPFKMTLTLRTEGRSADIGWQLACSGHEVREIYKAYTALNMICEDTTISVVDLRSGRQWVSMELAGSLAPEAQLPNDLGRLIEAVHTVAVALDQAVIWPNRPLTAEDYFRAVCLAEIVSKGTIELLVDSVSARWPKNHLEPLKTIISQRGTIRVSLASFPVAKSLFDTPVDVGPLDMIAAPSEIMEVREIEDSEMLGVRLTFERPALFIFPRFAAPGVSAATPTVNPTG